MADDLREAVARLLAAVREEDPEPRRQALQTIVAACDYAKGCKFTWSKAHRAGSFRVDGEDVLFDIERHGNPTWTTVQTWRVRPSGEMALEREVLPYDLQKQLRNARRGTESPDRETAKRSAIKAFEYATALCSLDCDADFYDTYVLAWVSCVACYGLGGKWPGAAKYVDLGYLWDGLSKKEQAADAREMNSRASALWQTSIPGAEKETETNG